jgi:protein gp37
MSTADLIALAAWHDDQAQAADRKASARDTASIVGVAAIDTTSLRERAQWHSSTAIHLRELADAFAQLVTVLRP